VKPADQSEKLTKILASELGQLRMDKGISLNELATRSGLNRQTIRFIELGTHRPTMTTLYQISIGLDFPLWKIMKKAEEGQV